jgi:L,D-transpeptidase YcbB
MTGRLISVVLAGAAFLSSSTGHATETNEALLRPLIDAGVLSGLRWPKFHACQGEVAKFYRLRGYLLAWTEHGTPTVQAQALIQAIQNAGLRGLDAEDYDGSRWAARLARLRPARTGPSLDDGVHFDLALTVSAMRFMSDLHLGKVNPRVFCFGLDVDQKKCDLADLLRDRFVKGSDIEAELDRIEPPYDGYRRTKRALMNYMQLASEDDGEGLPGTKKPVEPGQPYAGLVRLKHFLTLLGDLPAGAKVESSSSIYEGVVVDAVKRFQDRHGIDADGYLGTATLKHLNTPLTGRVRQLRLALERWRWAPDSFSRPPIVVNIPEFRLRAYNARYQPELEMKVVVGSAYRRQTPVFSNNMTHVIFRPYWNVPLSIQRNELLPKIRKDSAFLAKNDYQVLNSKGEIVSNDHFSPEMLVKLRSGKLSIRQVPGSKNALGFIKFVFPNEYNVYLHGTPAKTLFSKSRRDFSHGCIRVEKPEELALWALKERSEWDLDRIRAAENGARPLQVNLDKAIPVLIVYATAVVREAGEVCFFDDIYGHDRSLEELLERGYPYSEWKATSVSRGQHRRE